MNRETTVSVASPWTGIEGLKVGHAQDMDALTGCTVLLFPEPAIYAAYALGGGVSVRQVSALIPGHALHRADAVMVCGGSAYGLDAAGGVMAWLEKRGRGIKIGQVLVPSVPTVAIFDLLVGAGSVRPDQRMGWMACEAAREHEVLEGRVGAGAGATVGKVLGVERASWGGVGVATVKSFHGVSVFALAVVNAFGNVHDPDSRVCLAGARDEDGAFVDAQALVAKGLLQERSHLQLSGNTSVGVVVTDAHLNAQGCLRAAILASQALARCIYPSSTAVDGDIVFFCACGTKAASDPNALGVLGAEALSRAIVRAVTVGGAGEPVRLE